MRIKILLLSLPFLAFSIANANPLAIPSVNIRGLPLLIPHPTKPNTEITKSVNLAQLSQESLIWNVTCNYQASETNHGTFPISLRLSSNYLTYDDNFQSEIILDGQDVGPIFDTPFPLKISNNSGTITFTNVFAYQAPLSNFTFSNDDSTGNFELTSCIATNVPRGTD